MKVAMPIWAGRVSPVFDVAGRLLVIEVQGNREIGRQEWRVRDVRMPARAALVSDLCIDTLICGAISRRLEQLLIQGGVRVVPQTCGRAEEVLRAFLAGELGSRAFLMPGCRRRRRLGRRRGCQRPGSTMLSEGSSP